MRSVIIVPVYNEGVRAVNTVLEVLKNTKSKIVVVNDGSKDDSLSRLNRVFYKNKRVSVLDHVVNLGKGAAMKTGVEYAIKKRFDSFIFIDGDGQHNPKLLQLFEKGLSLNNLVFGYREFNSKMPLIRKWGNIFAVKLIKTLFNVKRRDLLCGYFGFTVSVYKKIIWDSARYGVETEIATRVGKKNLPFSEIKVDTIYHDKTKGVSMLDAVKILLNIPMWYYKN